METNILKMINVADLFSLANAVCGLLAIIFILQNNITLSAQLLLLAVLFDSVDGMVARYFNQGDGDNIFGQNIDSLADIVSFGVAPAIIIYMISGYTYMLIPSVLLVVCGILRLTRYNTISLFDTQPTSTFIGLPIPASSFILAALMLSSYNTTILFILMTIIAILMITDIEYPKIRETPILILTLLLMLLAFIPQINKMLFKIPAYLLLILGILYIFGIIAISIYDSPKIRGKIKKSTKENLNKL